MNLLLLSFVFFIMWVIIRKICDFCVNKSIQFVISKDNAEYFSNITVSFIHSSLSSIFCVVCFLADRSFLNDLVYGKTDLLVFLACFSTGYFVYDTFALILYPSHSNIYILVHHFLILSCLLCAVIPKILLPFSWLALVIEFSSITLHLRMLLKLLGYNRQNSKIYRYNLVGIFIFFFIFRFIVLVYIGYCVYDTYDRVSVIYSILASICLTTVFILSFGLIQRIIYADFYSKKLKLQ